MEIRPNIDRNRVKKAQEEFEMAEAKLDAAHQLTREGEQPNHAASFSNAQRCIERSTKAVFKLMNVQHDTEHAIGPESDKGGNLLNAISDEVTSLDYPAQAEGLLTKEEVEEIHIRAVARLLFLCEMYGETYPLSEYGINKNNIELLPNRFIEDGEYSASLESAVSALRISDAVIDSIAIGELPHTRRPAGPEGPMERRSGIKGAFYGVGKHVSGSDPVADYRRKL